FGLATVAVVVFVFLYLFFFVFFFSSRRRHTRLVSDWSSDVCSSDLVVVLTGQQAVRRAERLADRVVAVGAVGDGDVRVRERLAQIGRASCRERGEMSVGAGSLEKKERGERRGEEEREGVGEVGSRER